MDEMLEAFKRYENDVKKRINEQTLHSAAVDMRILALTSLFIDKGLITEKEVQGSYKEILEVVKNHNDFKDEKISNFEGYLKSFLQL